MYVLRVTYKPVPGKNREAVQLLKDRVQERTSLGQRILLASKVINAEGGPVHELLSFWDGLDEFADSWPMTTTKGPDQATAHYFQKMSPLLTGSVQSALWEVVFPVSTPPAKGEFVVRQSWYPGQGELEFGGAISELTKNFQAAGNNVGLYRQAFAPDGMVHQAIFPVKKLSDWEVLLGRRNDEVFRFLRTYGPRTRRPVSTDLWQIVTDPPRL